VLRVESRLAISIFQYARNSHEDKLASEERYQLVHASGDGESAALAPQRGRSMSRRATAGGSVGGLSMDQVVAARSIMQPLGRPIDARTRHYGTVEHFRQAPILAFRVPRSAAEHQVLSDGSSERDLAVSPPRAGHDLFSAKCGGGSGSRPRLRRA
jgi:hypothetical protein